MYLNVYRIIIIMIILMKKQFESKIQFEFDILQASGASQKIFWILTSQTCQVSEFWITIGDRLFFFSQCH